MSNMEGYSDWAGSPVSDGPIAGLLNGFDQQAIAAGERAEVSKFEAIGEGTINHAKLKEADLNRRFASALIGASFIIRDNFDLFETEWLFRKKPASVDNTAETSPEQALLNEKELKFVQMIIQGAVQSEITRQLKLRDQGYGNYSRWIMNKLDARSHPHIVRRAHEFIIESFDWPAAEPPRLSGNQKKLLELISFGFDNESTLAGALNITKEEIRDQLKELRRDFSAASDAHMVALAFGTPKAILKNATKKQTKTMQEQRLKHSPTEQWEPTFSAKLNQVLAFINKRIVGLDYTGRNTSEITIDIKGRPVPVSQIAEDLLGKTAAGDFLRNPHTEARARLLFEDKMRAFLAERAAPK